METLGEYRILRQVGEGGMGKVFEAEERLSGRRVALKVLRPELARSEPGRRLFENEMAILAGLDHPNVVRCLCCTEISGELVMALEEEFEIEIPDEDAEKITTVSQAISYISDRRK